MRHLICASVVLLMAGAASAQVSGARPALSNLDVFGVQPSERLQHVNPAPKLSLSQGQIARLGKLRAQMIAWRAADGGRLSPEHQRALQGAYAAITRG